MPVTIVAPFRRLTFLLIFATIAMKAHSQNNGLLISYRVKTTERAIENSNASVMHQLSGDLQEVHAISLEPNSSFSISIQGSNQSSYYDLKNEIVTIASRDTLYSSLPLYHIIDYRQAEYDNRIYLTNIMSKAGVNDPFGGYYNLETIFGLEFKENKVRDSILVRKSKDTTIFEIDGILLAKVHYSSKPLSPQFSASFSKYLTYKTDLHPSIKEKIAREKKIPDYIEYTFTNVATKITVAMRLEGVKSQRAGLPPSPEKLIWKIGTSNSLDRLLDSVSHHVTLHTVAPLDSIQCFLEADQLSKQGNNLSAILRLFEYLLQSGHTPTAHIRRIGTLQDTDPVLEKFFTCLGRPASKEVAERKIEGFRELISLQKKYSYIMNIFLANYISPIDLNKAQENFEIALKQNPFITGVYIDLGKTYSNRYNYASAWQCFDIAMKLNANHPMTRGIQANKDKLKADFPEYFSTN